MKYKNTFEMHFRSLLLIAIILFPTVCVAERVMCVWDPMGSQGDYYNMLRDYQLSAKRWNVDLSLRVYTDEGKSVADFKSGKCDIINMIGYRARLFNEFTGTIEAPGAINSYADMREVLSVVNYSKAEKYLTNGDYEVVGIIPLGAGYPFVDDRSINGVGPVNGKRIAVVDWDPVQSMLVRQVEAIPVPMDLTQFGPKFNAGAVDILLVPMVLYKPLELSIGIGSHGGIIHRPVLQFTMQLISRHNKFPEGFGVNSRDYMLKQVSFALGVIRNQESAVEQAKWIYGNTGEVKEFGHLMANARSALTKAGFYDRKMLNVMKRVRCKNLTVSDAGCGAEDE